jgi:cytochrome c oxidase subunit IV
MNQMRIIKSLKLFGLVYLTLATLSSLYSHFHFNGLFTENHFDRITYGFFNFGCYLGLITYMFLGQKLIFFILTQILIIVAFMLMIKALEELFLIKNKRTK